MFAVVLCQFVIVIICCFSFVRFCLLLSAPVVSFWNDFSLPLCRGGHLSHRFLLPLATGVGCSYCFSSIPPSSTLHTAVHVSSYQMIGLSIICWASKKKSRIMINRTFLFIHFFSFVTRFVCQIVFFFFVVPCIM